MGSGGNFPAFFDAIVQSIQKEAEVQENIESYTGSLSNNRYQDSAVAVRQKQADQEAAEFNARNPLSGRQTKIGGNIFGDATDEGYGELSRRKPLGG